MPSLLSITASPRGAYSISNSLVDTFVETWKRNHPEGSVTSRNLHNTELPFVDLPWIAGAYTPEETHSPEIKKALSIGNMLIAELQAADHIVIGTPMYNFSTPAILKAWIDHICRVNVTFTPQYEGLLKNKKTTLIIASGGVYGPGSPTEAYNFETVYLKAILGFVGLTDLDIVLAGGSSGVSTGKISQQDLVAQFIPQVQALAA